MTRPRRFENPHCDGSGPHAMTEARIYPLNPGANARYCIACFSRENQYRYSMATIDPETNLRRKEEQHDLWPQVDWNTAEVYQP